MIKRRIGELFGWMGLLVIQFASIPPVVNILIGNGDRVPPIETVVLVWSGILLYLIRSVIQKDTLFIVSNAIGFCTQSALLSLIVLK